MTLANTSLRTSIVSYLNENLDVPTTIWKLLIRIILSRIAFIHIIHGTASVGTLIRTPLGMNATIIRTAVWTSSKIFSVYIENTQRI